MLGMMVTAFLMIFYPAISRRLSRKRLMDILMAVSAIGYVLMLLPGMTMTKGTVMLGGMDLKFVLITFGYMLANFNFFSYICNQIT